MSKVILYSKEHCPMCKLLETELKSHNISFEKNMNIDEMFKMGIKSVPVLSVDGKLMGLAEAMRYVKGQEV